MTRLGSKRRNAEQVEQSALPDLLRRLVVRIVTWRPMRARSAKDALLVGLGRFLFWYALLIFYVVYWDAHPWLFTGFWRLDVIYGGGGFELVPVR